MYKYEIQIKDLDGVVKGVITNFKSLDFSHVLNREGLCSFTISLSDSKVTSDMIQPGRREVYIYREDTRVWGGTMVMLQGGLSADNDDMTVYAKSFFDLFKARYTDDERIFSATDAGTIAWTLIDESQNLTDGDFGISQGTIDASVNRDRTYRYKNIYDAIIQLAEVNNGFDFEITAAKEFTVDYPYRGDDLSANQVLEWGKNIKQLKRFIFDFTEPANEVTVLGSGDTGPMNVSTRTNTQMRSDYKLRQLVYPYKEVEAEAFLEAKGDELLSKRAYVRREYEISQVAGSYPTYGILQIGDWLRVKVNHSEFLEINDVVRINKQRVDVSQGKEVMSYNFQYD